jgi:hypothetical protein
MNILSPIREGGEAERLAPWGQEPGRLWSLWDMLKNYAWEFFVLSSLLERMRFQLGLPPLSTTAPFSLAPAGIVGTPPGLAGLLSNLPPVAPELDDLLKENLTTILPLVASSCEKLGMRKIRRQIERILSDVNHAPNKTELKVKISVLCETIGDNLQTESFMYVSEKNFGYYQIADLFGKDVATKFPSANDDIIEAGTCLSLGRATACVMHLMKVLEAGLAALAAAVGVGAQNDWGRYITEIEKEPTARIRGLKARSGDEQFYAEAAVNFDNLRRAYRNPTMHRDRSYSPERAEEILIAVRSFMIHLSTKLVEIPQA